MSLPKIKKLPSFMRTDLKELNEEYKKIYGNTNEKNPKVSEKKNSNSPPKKRRERDAPTIINSEFDIISLTPRIDVIKQLPLISEYKTNKKPSTKGTSKRKHEITLPEIITKTHGIHLINDKPKLPPIGKGGKRRTRKNKSNRRRTLRKK
jgi:hypothetical protein